MLRGNSRYLEALRSEVVSQPQQRVKYEQRVPITVSRRVMHQFTHRYVPLRTSLLLFVRPSVITVKLRFICGFCLKWIVKLKQKVKLPPAHCWLLVCDKLLSVKPCRNAKKSMLAEKSSSRHHKQCTTVAMLCISGVHIGLQCVCWRLERSKAQNSRFIR